MEKNVVIFGFLLLCVPQVYSDTNCNDAINAFFEYEEKKTIESDLITSINKAYPKDSVLVQLSEEIAKEVSKIVGCTLTEKKATDAIEKVLKATDKLFDNRPEPKRKEYIKFIGNVLKKTCDKLDKL